MKKSYKDSQGVLINIEFDYEWKCPEVDGYPDRGDQYLVAVGKVDDPIYDVAYWSSMLKKFDINRINETLIAWKRIEWVNTKKI